MWDGVGYETREQAWVPSIQDGRVVAQPAEPVECARCSRVRMMSQYAGLPRHWFCRCPEFEPVDVEAR